MPKKKPAIAKTPKVNPVMKKDKYGDFILLSSQRFVDISENQHDLSMRVLVAPPSDVPEEAKSMLNEDNQIVYVFKLVGKVSTSQEIKIEVID